MAARTVGVRFRQAGKVFYYDALEFELTVGDYVVVDATQGLACGRVVIAPDQVIENQSSNQSEMKPILRIATQEDLDRMEAAREKAQEDLRTAKARAAEQGLDMTIAGAEYDLDGGQFTAYFSAQERVDFRGLVRDLSRELGTRVQLLQVGDRDRAKLVDGFDICGERLCCSSWMTNFPAVSIRMAKEQDLPLNPQKISGVCGRLYCCLTFEYEDYKELRGKLPKVGSVHSTPAGEAKVTGIDFNREVVKLMITETRTPFEVPAIDFQLQNGVTIRPMDLVRKIEGPMRTITEDSSARPATREAPSDGSGNGSGRSRGGRRRRGRGGGGGEAPAASSAPAPAPQQPARPPAQEASGSGDADGAAKRRRRRRRGRGRGGGGGEGAPSAPNGD